jgi:pyrophosphatase PpaX
MKPLRAVLFDWDGTLADSAEATYSCYVRLFGGYGISFDREAFERTYSPEWHRTYQALGLAEADWPEADRRWVEFFHGEPKTLVPGAERTLSRLAAAGFALGLVTSGSRGRVSRDLEALGLRSCFQAVVYAEDASRGKPHPEPLLRSLDLLGLRPPDAAYVGDSPEDIAMARAAGSFAVAVPGGFPNREALRASAPDCWAETLEQATEALLARGAAGPGTDR